MQPTLPPLPLRPKRSAICGSCFRNEMVTPLWSHDEAGVLAPSAATFLCLQAFLRTNESVEVSGKQVKPKALFKLCST